MLSSQKVFPPLGSVSRWQLVKEGLKLIATLGTERLQNWQESYWVMKNQLLKTIQILISLHLQVFCFFNFQIWRNWCPKKEQVTLLRSRKLNLHKKYNLLIFPIPLCVGLWMQCVFNLVLFKYQEIFIHDYVFMCIWMLPNIIASWFITE